MAPGKKIVTTSEFVPNHIGETEKDKKEQKVAKTVEAMQAGKGKTAFAPWFDAKQKKNSTAPEATTSGNTPANDPALVGSTTPAPAESLPGSTPASPVLTTRKPQR